jgi:antitoxin (DNA-binding transcriptional repressor) of toxin-antitoxin stability system
MAVTASRLRENIYGLLDKVLETGEPLVVERKGRVLKIVPEGRRPKLSRLVRRPCIKGRAEALVHVDWSKEWRP